MENIFDIKFTFEQRAKDDVIYRFSNKQGGDFNVFAYHWQCFAWAAIIGFLHDRKRPLESPKADQSFRLNTMMNNGGEKIAKALVCMCIAKTGTLDIMKEPQSAINLINEYANGGFDYIREKINQDGGMNNDFEWVKQEVFSREIIDGEFITPKRRRDRIRKFEKIEPIQTLPNQDIESNMNI